MELLRAPNYSECYQCYYEFEALSQAETLQVIHAIFDIIWFNDTLIKYLLVYPQLINFMYFLLTGLKFRTGKFKLTFPAYSISKS